MTALTRAELLIIQAHIDAMLAGEDQWMRLSDVVSIISKKSSFKWAKADRNHHDQQMTQLQDHPAAHPNDCLCDWCKPLTVARSATFTAAQASLAKPEKAQE